MKKLVWIFLSITFYSNCQTPGNGVTDIDGNTYNSVIIGTQEWQKENLNVSKYSDGTIIPQVTDPTQWANLTTGAWCYYQNNTANGVVYGKIYNWYAVAGIYNSSSFNNPSLRKQLAPQGWHIPSNAEWSSLINHLDPNANGGASLSNIAGGKMKEAGTAHWNSPNTGADNSSSFTGLPGGNRLTTSGTYYGIGDRGDWWSSSEYNSSNAWYINIVSNDAGAGKFNFYKEAGLSVRCLNNNLLTNSTFETNSINLYPNPVINILNIKTNENLINQTFTIIDSLGRVVLNGKLNEVDTVINVEQLSKGIYYLKIAGNSATKFIKE